MERWRGRGRGSGRESGGGQGGRETNIYRPLFFERERERAEEVTEERQRGVGRQGGQFWSACHYTHTHTHTHTHTSIACTRMQRPPTLRIVHKKPQAPQDHHAMSGLPYGKRDLLYTQKRPTNTSSAARSSRNVRQRLSTVTSTSLRAEALCGFFRIKLSTSEEEEARCCVLGALSVRLHLEKVGGGGEEEETVR